MNGSSCNTVRDLSERIKRGKVFRGGKVSGFLLIQICYCNFFNLISLFRSHEKFITLPISSLAAAYLVAGNCIFYFS